MFKRFLPRKTVTLTLPTAALGMVIAACTVVPDTGRRQINLVSDAKVAEMGLSEFENYKKSKPISRDRAKNAALQRVASRLTRVIDLPGARWEFVVFDDPSANAFALPGGKVGVNTGIFEITQNDAGLATVVGHEIGHVVARHGNERLSQKLIATGGGAILGAVLGTQNDMSGATKTGVLAAYGATATGTVLKFSRDQELEADQLGTLYLARAGYQPEEAVAFWSRFAEYKNKKGSRKLPEFLSTHPLDSRRIRALEAFLPRAKAEMPR